MGPAGPREGKEVSEKPQDPGPQTLAELIDFHQRTRAELALLTVRVGKLEEQLAKTQDQLLHVRRLASGV